MPEGYDLIGDIHGQAGKLHALLDRLGYRDDGWAYRHPSRHAIFVGDFVDRGPRQLGTVDIVRRMVDAGSAQAVMGNHEFNAIAWSTPDPDADGEFLRPHSDKNRRQHAAFLREVEDQPDAHASLIEWFYTLPLWLDLDGVRVIHACWHPWHQDYLQDQLSIGDTLTEDLLIRASRRGSPEYQAVETLLKGMEVTLPPPHSFTDKDGHVRHQIRTRWWDNSADTYASAALLGADIKATLPDDPLPSDRLLGYDDPQPVFFGHYWMTGTPRLQAPRVACVDYSAGNDGPLCAYRWQGEAALRPAHFVLTD